MRMICGVVRLDRAVAEPTMLEAMATALIPDGLSPRLSQSLDGPAGLMLLDFAATAEPGRPPDDLPEQDGWLVAADLRLDRPEALALGLSCPRDLPPEALLVRAVEAYGDDFPDRIDGDFAVALWHRQQQRLWLGRDFIGARPLAWSYQPGRFFAFASFPKGLHRSGFASRTPDPVALGAMFLQNYFRGADSGFADIRYLLPGHSLTIGPGMAEPREHRAWRPQPAQVGCWPHGPEAAAEEMRRLVTEAVAARLPTRGVTACHLSGGLDSSSITVLAARGMRLRKGRVLALSLIGEDHPEMPVTDDRALMRAVLDQEGDLDWVAVASPPHLDLALTDEDRPLAELGSAEASMARAAADAGADILLSGIGGDEGATYNGVGLYCDLMLAGKLRHLWKELPARAVGDGVPLTRALYHRLLAPLFPLALHQWRRRVRGVPQPKDPKQGRPLYFTADLRQEVMARKLAPALRKNTAEERVRTFTDHHIPGRLVFTALTAARYGLAVSFPLLDRQVVNLALSLPLEHFLADGHARQPFRRAMRGILPEEIRQWRHKITPMASGYLSLAAAKNGFMAMLEQIAAEPGNAALLDLNLIRQHLASIPEPAESLAFAQRMAVETWNPIYVPWQMGSAVAALALARHLAQRP